MRGYLTVWILGAGCSLGGVALAQQDVLRGPKVEDAGPPGVPEKFGEAMQRPAGEAGQRVPMRAYTRALRSLRDAEDESLRLSPEQAESIREVMLAYRDDVREALAPRGGPAAGKAKGTTATADAEAVPERPTRRSQRARVQGEQEGAMSVDAMRSLGEAMPDAASYQRRVWELLTADQQALVEQALEAELEILRKKRAERMAEMASTGKDRAADVARERLRSMTPEQRRELMQRERDRSRLERDQGDAKKSGQPTNDDT
ncbi:MAG: hypothetical protein AAFY58_07055 [Planctomycetota bacterium]